LELSNDFLQTSTKVPFVWGFAASCFQDERHCSIPVLKLARADSGTFVVTQASYFVRKSSHSGTPILSAAAVSVLVSVLVSVVVLVVLVFATTVVFEFVVFVGAELQAVNPIEPPARATIKNRFLFNLIISYPLKLFNVLDLMPNFGLKRRY
jgi:hypothetical protein